MLVSGAASAALVLVSWLAQSEPAPSEEVPLPVAAADPVPSPAGSSQDSSSRQPLNAVGVHGRFAARPTGSTDGLPREGFSLGGTFERRYASVAETFAFGVGLDFFFDRFSNGATQNSFVALQTVTLERLAVHPWIGAGAGVGIAASARAVARGAVGIELAFARGSSLALRADLTHALSSPEAFGDVLDVGLGLLQRF
jgi:hypothetical protein